MNVYIYILKIRVYLQILFDVNLNFIEQSLSRETYRPQRSRDGSPRRAGGSLSSYASVAATSSASHRRSWAGSSAGGAAAPTRPESTTIPTLVVENSR